MTVSTPQNSHGYTILGIALALGFIISSFVIASALKTIKMANQSITVKGYAEKNLTADLAVWRSNVSVRTQTLAEGYDRLQGDLKKIMNYLNSKGIKKEMISVGAVNSMVQFRQEGNTSYRDGYQMEQMITITSKDVNHIMKLSTDASEIIREGVEFQSYTPEFYYTKLNDLKIEMLGAASKDARVRAETLAKNSKSEVGALKSAQQGVFQITSTNSTEVSDFGEYDLSTIEKTIKSVVTIEYYTK